MKHPTELGLFVSSHSTRESFSVPRPLHRLACLIPFVSTEAFLLTRALSDSVIKPSAAGAQLATEILQLAKRVGSRTDGTFSGGIGNDSGQNLR